MLQGFPLGSVPLGSVPLGSVRTVPALAHSIAHGPAVLPHTIAHAPAVVRTVVPAVAPEPAVIETIDPSYQFGYTVTDTKTGDAKAREEVSYCQLFVYFFPLNIFVYPWFTYLFCTRSVMATS